MTASLTISLALYLFFIILPGYISLIVAGYPANEKGSVYKIIIRGSIIFLLVTELIVTFFADTELAKQYLNMIKGDRIINGRYLLLTVGVMITIGFITGYLQLLFDFSFVWFAKKELKHFARVAGQKIEVAPGDSLKKLFTCYRIANIRPFVKIILGVNNEEAIYGEVLKFTWNGSEHLLIKEIGSKEIVWLDIKNCKLIQFKNIEMLARPLLKEKSKVKDIREKMLQLNSQ